MGNAFVSTLQRQQPKSVQYTNNSTPACHEEVFENCDLHCKILQYLDFYSRLKCDLVSNTWNHHSKNPSSIYFFRFAYCLNHDGGKNAHINDIKRFKNARYLNHDFCRSHLEVMSITKRIQLSEQFNLFRKIEKLDIGAETMSTKQDSNVNDMNYCLYPLLNTLAKKNNNYDNFQLKHLQARKYNYRSNDECISDTIITNKANKVNDYFLAFKSIVLVPNYYNLEYLSLGGFELSYNTANMLFKPCMNNLKILKLNGVDYTN